MLYMYAAVYLYIHSLCNRYTNAIHRAIEDTMWSSYKNGYACYDNILQVYDDDDDDMI